MVTQPFRAAPLWSPALALSAGCAAASSMTWLPVPLLVALLLASLLLRGRIRLLVFALALGLLRATVAGELPAEPLDGVAVGRPVVVEVRPTAPWRRDEDGWFAPARVELLRQGTHVGTRRFDLWLGLPGPEPPPAPGSLLRVRGHLRRSPGFANGPWVEPGPWRLTVKSRRLMDLTAPPGPLARISARWRGQVEDAIRRTGMDGGPGIAWVRALVLGDPTGLEPSVRRGLSRHGVGHLLALSGLHVGLLAGFVYLLATPLPRGLRLLLPLAAVTAYVLVAGPRPSLLRAAVMAAAAAAALALERPPSPLNALGMVVLGLVLHRPEIVSQTGFQLTVAATAGILWLAFPLGERWRRPRGPLPAGWAFALAVPVAAQVATLPWAASRFFGVAPLGALINLIAAPWAALVLAAGLAWTALAWGLPGLAAHGRPVLDVLTAPAEALAAVPAGPWSFWPWAPSLPVASAVTAVWVLGLLYGGRRTILVVSGAVASAALLVVLTGAFGKPPVPELVMLDVGQGDAILLRDGSRAVLVDGGGFPGDFDVGGRVLLPALARLGVRRLDAAVLTHADRDHCGGLADLAGWLPVAEVWMARGTPPGPCVDRLGRIPGATVRELSAGDRRSVGRWRLRVLWPEIAPGARSAGSDNERSLVLRAETSGRVVLLTGDVGAATERRLLRRGRPKLVAQVLKVAHHGSKSSSTEGFLDAVSPRWALISAGSTNPYGHPAPEVLDRLARRRVWTLRTDTRGLIRLRFPTGGPVSVSTPFAPKPAPIH